MDPFQRHFGWECGPDAAPGCVDASESTKDFDKGFINGLFGAGATVGAIINPYFAERFGRRVCLAFSIGIDSLEVEDRVRRKDRINVAGWQQIGRCGRGHLLGTNSEHQHFS